MKKSAGLLVYRHLNNELEVLLVHPGGPFYSKKDIGVWSIPKGEYTSEDPLTIALQEFNEETGNIIQSTSFKTLGYVTLTSGKIINAWAVKNNLEKSFICSNTFEIEWPPKSGKMGIFPEVDKAEWFSLSEAKLKIHPAQITFLERLSTILTH